ncbi:MAG: sugar ABC transporter ATP-binding protein [Oscillospiraceae bacterium]|jgi:ribose transport system ATP-binding protein|nr:sugar ABC transporter ATP-binding protein [Oscillospiraceae bacterium]
MAILEMRDIHKSFGGTRVLHGVDFTVEPGEIHALLGENGAGKSTLMNILSGVIPMDSGSVVFAGRAYPSPGIRQMEQAGIAFVHQERSVVNDLAVYENIFLGRELKKGVLLDKKAMVAHTDSLFGQLGVTIDPLALVSTLKTSEKQLLEICRALDINAKLLIMDEPTTALSGEEVEHLFEILRRLCGQGTSFIFISHKMTEIFELSNRYTVLRNGIKISEGLIKDVTPHKITSDMVGEQYAGKNSYTPRPLGETALSLKGFSGPGFRNVELEVRKSEIVAFTGLAGSGASELMQAMFGVLPVTAGRMLVNGRGVGGGIFGAMKNRIAMLPSNRKENSVVPDQSILENEYIAEHSLSRRRPFINEKEELHKFGGFQKMLRIKAQSPHDPVTSLSGGNQQKVFLARWLNIGADILLFDNPTQGVDVGAKDEIYRLILEFAREGKTIIINTLEIPEIKKVSDRCVVFYEGEIIKIFSHDEIDEHTVMLYSTNAIGTREGEAL